MALELLRAVLTALAAGQLVLLLLRAPGCRSRRELGSFFLFVLCAALAGLLPGRDPWAAIGFLLLPWSAGVYAASLVPAGRAGLWSLVVAACAAALAGAALLGYRAVLPGLLLRLFLGVALAVYPALLLLRAWSARREAPLLALLAAYLVLQLALALDLLVRSGLPGGLPAAVPAALGALLVSGYRLAQEGYLLARGWGGLARRLEQRERLLAAARLRLLEVEDSLDLADRLTAAGLLAGGAAHEFRGVLGLIRSTAEFALRQGDPAAGRRSLELILEQAAHGRESAEGLLEAVGRGADARRRPLRLPADIEGLLRLVRAAFRREGLRLAYAREPVVAALACKAELEHILLTLLRNAADSLRPKGGGEVRLRFAPRPGAEPGAVVEVEDDGGGVSPELERRMFDPGVSSKGSSGLGLYLARRLAERGGGSLEYAPRPAGSLFRLLLPGAASSS